MAAWLPLRAAGAVVSHESALELYGLGDAIPDAVDQSVSRSQRGQRPHAGVRLHTGVRPLEPGEIRPVAGIVATSPERTLVDCAAASTAPDQVELAIRQALTRSLTTPHRLQSLSRPGTGGGRFSSTKSRAGVRTVALPTAAVEGLADHMARFTPAGRDALVFATGTGRPLTGGSRTTMFARARRAIGRDDLAWHDLRHSAMTLVAQTGATPPQLMQRAGHSTPRAALHYRPAADDAGRRIADRLDTVVGRAPSAHAAGCE